MKKFQNEINLQGYVYSIGGNGTIYRGTTGPESKVPNTDYMTANINIATDEDGVNIVPVRFGFTTQYFKSGNENSNWAVLNEIENDNATWAEKGKEGAYKIRLTAQVGSNPFVDRNTGEIVDRPSINVNFAHPSNNGFNDSQRDTFKLDVLMIGYNIVESEDSEDFGRITGYAFDSFRKEMIPVTLVIRNPDGVKYFDTLDISKAHPVLTNVWGTIKNTTIKTEHEIESAFGAPTVEYTTRSLREWVIDGCAPNPMPFDDESTITAAEVKECLANHQNVIAAAQARFEQRNAAPSAFNSGSSSTGQATTDFKF